MVLCRKATFLQTTGEVLAASPLAVVADDSHPTNIMVAPLKPENVEPHKTPNLVNIQQRKVTGEIALLLILEFEVIPVQNSEVAFGGPYDMIFSKYMATSTRAMLQDIKGPHVHQINPNISDYECWLLGQASNFWV
ncbi:hypothetical protein VNO77_23633 [Canavalia gladiata]|uniref:Uncharacterized protein n=1 Tax=Canavalia gladiata TaxID=3824 RepID=A0AAN9QC07_CANGL